MAARSDIAYAMNGSNSAFAPPSNYNELAGYSSRLRKKYATDLQARLLGRRTTLAQALTDQGKALFDRADPGILENLNNNGVFTSPTAVATARANALRDIGLANQQHLNEFDDAATAQEHQEDVTLSGRRCRKR